MHDDVCFWHQKMRLRLSALGTLSPSTAAQQPRQLWEGRADPKRNGVEGLDLTPKRPSRAPALRDATSFSVGVRHLIFWHPRKSGGSREATRVHHTSRRRGGWLASCCACATASEGAPRGMDCV